MPSEHGLLKYVVPIEECGVAFQREWPTGPLGQLVTMEWVMDEMLATWYRQVMGLEAGEFMDVYNRVIDQVCEIAQLTDDDVLWLSGKVTRLVIMVLERVGDDLDRIIRPAEINTPYTLVLRDYLNHTLYIELDYTT